MSGENTLEILSHGESETESYLEKHPTYVCIQQKHTGNMSKSYKREMRKRDIEGELGPINFTVQAKMCSNKPIPT